MNKNLIALAALLLSLSACGGDNTDTSDEPTPGQDQTPDVVDQTPDEPVDEPDARPDMTDAQPDMCMPKTSCDDACGRVDDGCGGTLECGSCECTNGEPAEPSCGPCGLGTASCDAQGVRSCNAPPEIPGLAGLDADACAEALIYVALSGGGNEEDGSRAAPYRTVDAALDAAAQKPEVKAVLIGGANEYRSQTGQTGLNLRDGVSLIGGWDDAWQYKPEENLPTLVGVGRFQNGDVYAVSARDIASPTLLQHLLIKSGLNITAGRSTYGLHAIDSSGLILQDVRLIAGAAGNGGHGADGGRGANGPRGFDARPPVLGSNDQGRPGIAAGMNTHAQCSPAPNLCAGGKGGHGRNSPMINVSPVQPGEASVSGAAGGDAGAFGTPSGRPGEQGTVTGPQAQGGTGGLSQGRVEGGFWLQEGDGADGAQGPQGGGGGGGGGAWISGNDCGLPLPDRCPAPSGGGGGVGGEGGKGGEGGGGGGGSFGLFAVSSNITVRGSYISGGFGGAGGNAGAGGIGGRGGDGGKGGDSYTSAMGHRIVTLYKGGDGGRGADGFPGGHGGGGAGGPSYGAYCENSILTIDTETTFAGGGSAFAGASQGLPGQAGLSVDQHRCRP